MSPQTQEGKQVRPLSLFAVAFIFGLFVFEEYHTLWCVVFGTYDIR